MATKQELAAEAEEYAKALGDPVKTEGLNHGELSALVESLGKRFADSGGQKPPQAPSAPSAAVVGDADPGSGTPPKPQAPSAQFPLCIAPGKTVTHPRARKGSLMQGEQVFEKDFDPETLATLIRKRIVLDNRGRK